jgi:hypothetical protein
MHASPHYYVISLSRRATVLFEAFRDTLIDIQNGGFPVVRPGSAIKPPNADEDDKRFRDALKLVDDRFCHFYDEEPLKLVVVGERDVLDTFLKIATHPDAILGCVEGDFSQTSPVDLGKIVWPVVKESMSGIHAAVMADLNIAKRKERIAMGIESVSLWLCEGVGTRLIVEDDYHVRGSIDRTGPSVVVTSDVDVMAEMDDVVDVVIDNVLKIGGTVVFVPGGSLERMKRIVLLLEK